MKIMIKFHKHCRRQTNITGNYDDIAEYPRKFLMLLSWQKYP